MKGFGKYMFYVESLASLLNILELCSELYLAFFFSYEFQLPNLQNCDYDFTCVLTH